MKWFWFQHHKCDFLLVAEYLLVLEKNILVHHHELWKVGWTFFNILRHVIDQAIKQENNHQINQLRK